MNNLYLLKKAGFTIIEVIIVLTIAAIIVMLVFLILPQATQTQRNTRRKNDLNRIQAAVIKLSEENSNFWRSSGTDITSEVFDITGNLTDPNSNSNYVIKIGSSTSNTPNQIVVKNNASCNNNTFADTNGSFAIAGVTEPFSATTQAKNTTITGQIYCINN